MVQSAISDCFVSGRKRQPNTREAQAIDFNGITNLLSDCADGRRRVMRIDSWMMGV